MMVHNKGPKDILHNLSTHDFQLLGVEQIAYVKPVEMDNKKGYGVYSAEGALIGMQDNHALAALVARQNGLQPCPVH